MPQESIATPNLPKSLFLTILNNEYEVKLPNTGQEIDIALLLQQISNEKYESLKMSFLPVLLREAVKIETIAHFNVLIPKLKENLTVKSLFELDRLKMDILVNAYTGQFLPWYEEWQAFFANPTEKKEEAKG